MAVYKYKIHCNTENADKLWLLRSEDPSPTKCPTDTSHSVDLSSVAVLAIGEDQFKKNSSGALLMDNSNTVGIVGAQSITINSHDWSDRTTWYQRSVRVLDEQLVDNLGTKLIFNAANGWWVNMDNDRVTYDYKVVPKRDGIFGDRADFRPVVKVDGVIVTTGFTVDYVAGTVTFGAPQLGVVTADYSHNNNVTRRSEWILCPPPGYAYLVDYIEMQFSKNVVFNPQGIVIEVWAGGNQLGGPVPDVYGDFPQEMYDQGFGQNKSIYKGPKDFLNICTNRSSQVIPAFAGLAQDLLIFPFDYLIQTQIKSSQGTVIALALADDAPYTGAELATATFYMQLVPESSLGAV